jgi:gas vesicle protein
MKKERTMSEKNGGSNRMTAFLLGGLIGAAVGVLYAPRSGDKTRQLLMETSEEIKDKALNSIQEVRASAMTALEEAEQRLGTFSEESKVRLDKLQKIGKSTLQEQKESLKAGLEEAKKTMAEPVEGDNTGGPSGQNNSSPY